MHRFLLVAIGYSITAQPAALEPAMSVIADDWIRINANTWVLWSEKTIATCDEIVRGKIGASDHVFIVKIDLSERAGWMPKWMWDWLNKPRGGALNIWGTLWEQTNSQNALSNLLMNNSNLFFPPPDDKGGRGG